MNRLALISLLALTLLVFGRLCAAEFVEWDDPSTISRDAAFNPPTFSSVAIYWRGPQLNIYIPLTCTVWGLLASVGRLAQPDETGSLLNPWIFHAANICVHAINVLLIWRIARALGANRSAAWIGAAIFAVHPIQVEAVAWATDMKDLLCSAFAFLAIFLWIKHRKENESRLPLRATLALLASCLSKPTGVIVPMIVLIIDTMILRIPFRKSLAKLSSWFIVSIIFAIVATHFQPPVQSHVASMWIRPLIAADAIAFYLWKLIWPVNLAIDYGRTPQLVLARGWIAFTWLAPAITALCFYFSRREKRATGLIFLAGLLPVLGLVPFTFQSLSTVADHYLYLPMLAVALLIATLAQQFHSRATIALAAVVIAVFSIQSFRIAGNWKNSATLFNHALAVNPRSAMSHTNLAVALTFRGDSGDAIDHLQRAVEIDPDYAFAHLNLAGLLLQKGERAGALREFRDVLRIYQTQRNYDPKLAASVQARISQLTNESGESR